MGSHVLEPVLAVALDADSLAEGQLDPHRWLEVVLAAERAGADLVTIGDSHRLGTAGPRLDAALLSAWLAPRTTRIGLVPEINTTVSEPFLVASQIATVDFASRGRAGWLAQVSAEESDAGYVGPRAVAVGDAGWAEAAEYAEVLSRLWDSWEDGAEIRDLEAHRFIDTERVHYVDFAGAHLSVKGPSITPRPPQGQPPSAVAVGADPRALTLAGAAADVVFVAVSAGVGADAVREAVSAAGRSPEAVRILADVGAPAGEVLESEALLEEALDRGFDGLRLIPGALPLVLAPLGEPPAVQTLRERLGLERPDNRYARSEVAR